MLYAIISEDVNNSLERRLAARPDHLARLEALRDEGRLVLAGPHPAIDSESPGDAGFSGSLVVAEFDDLASAQAWADADPFVIAGVYAKVTVKPFKRVLPDPDPELSTAGFPQLLWIILLKRRGRISPGRPHAATLTSIKL